MRGRMALGWLCPGGLGGWGRFKQERGSLVRQGDPGHPGGPSQLSRQSSVSRLAVHPQPSVILITLCKLTHPLSLLSLTVALHLGWVT